MKYINSNSSTALCMCMCAKCKGYLEHCGANHKHLSYAYRREGKPPLATEPHIAEHIKQKKTK